MLKILSSGKRGTRLRDINSFTCLRENLLRNTFKTISHSGFSQYIARARGVFFEFVTEVADSDPQDMGLLEIGNSPYLFKDHAVGQDLPGIDDKESQQVIFRRGEGNSYSLQ